MFDRDKLILWCGNSDWLRQQSFISWREELRSHDWRHDEALREKAKKSGLRRSHGPFESFPDKARVRNAARLCPSLDSGQQRPGHTHVDLFILFLKFKPRRFELRKIKVRQVLREKRFRFLVCFESWHFLFHRLQSPSRAYSGPSRVG